MSLELGAERVLVLFYPVARRPYVALDLTLKSTHLRRLGLPGFLLLKQRARLLPKVPLELPDLDLELPNLDLENS